MTEESTLVAACGGSQVSRLSRHRRVAIAYSSYSSSMPHSPAYIPKISTAACGDTMSLVWSRLGFYHPSKIGRARQLRNTSQTLHYCSASSFTTRFQPGSKRTIAQDLVIARTMYECQGKRSFSYGDGKWHVDPKLCVLSNVTHLLL